MRNRYTTLFFILICTVTAVSFQNCSGTDFLVDETTQSSEVPIEKLNVCENILYNEFLKPEGFYTFLSQKCSSCHNGLGQGPGFASTNTFTAWEKFSDKEINSDFRVSERAVSDHQPGVTGEQNLLIINKLKEEFAVAQIKFNTCEEELGNVGKDKVPLKPLKTTALLLNFLKPGGEDLTTAEKQFLRSESLKYYVQELNSNNVGTGIYVEHIQVLQGLNPYERPVFDTTTNSWKKIALKKVSSAELNDEEKSHIRVETYLIFNSAGDPVMAETKQKEKTYFLNPFERIKKDSDNNPVVDSKTFEPIVEKLARKGRYTFDLQQGTYTPDVIQDEPYVTFSIELFRSQRPIVKTDQRMTIKKRLTATTTQNITYTRTLGYTQVLDPYIVIKRPDFVINNNIPGTIYPQFAYQIQDLGIILNSTLQSDRTIFRILDSVICEKSPINVMVKSNAEILALDFTMPNTIHFEFKNVNKVDRAEFADRQISCSEDEKLSEDIILPDHVTYTELMGSTDLNVFKKSCVSCHSASNLAGGFDISNYAKAKEKNSKIVERMNNANSPMPPTGILNPKARQLVQKWISLGSPL